MSEALTGHPEWGNSQADEIIARITSELAEAGVVDSYNAALSHTRQQLVEADIQVPPRHHPPYDGKSLDDVLAADLPVLPVGLERDDMLDPFHSIASVALVKVDPRSGEILSGSFLRFIAEVYEGSFDKIHPDFDELKAALILQKALELRYSGLFPWFNWR